MASQAPWESKAGFRAREAKESCFPAVLSPDSSACPALGSQVPSRKGREAPGKGEFWTGHLDAQAGRGRSRVARRQSLLGLGPRGPERAGLCQLENSALDRQTGLRETEVWTFCLAEIHNALGGKALPSFVERARRALCDVGGQR